MARWLNVGEIPLPADYVLPLSGDPDTRPFVAAALYKTGFASRVLVSRVAEGPAPSAGPWPAPHEITQRVLVSRGVPPERIELLSLPHSNTFEEAIAVGQFLSAHPGATITIVTNHFHTRRARWAFRKVLAAQSDDLHFVAAPYDGFDESNWWRVDEGFATYLTEYVKLSYYVLRYGNGLGWIALVVVSLVVANRKIGQRRIPAD